MKTAGTSGCVKRVKSAGEAGVRVVTDLVNLEYCRSYYTRMET